MPKNPLPPNIILIVIDALRARNLGCYGGPDPTPHIDGLARNGFLFENAFSSWNTTDQSLTSIMSGRCPRTHGIIHHGDKVKKEDLRNFRSLKVTMLAELLRERGYATWSVDWMKRWFKRGFDFYGYKPERRFPGSLLYHLITLPYLHAKYMIDNISLLRLYAGKRRVKVGTQLQTFRDVLSTFRFTFELARIQDGGQVVNRGMELIGNNRERPFFLFLHFWDTHSPYNAPRRFMPARSRVGDARDRLHAKYRGAVRYADAQVGRLAEFLKKSDLLDNTLLIVTSDHGESLDEHDIFFDHHGLYDVTTHVPLVLHGPAVLPGSGTSDAFVQHIDLVPTICERLGIDRRGLEFDGKSWMPLLEGRSRRIRDFVFNEESYVQRKIAIRTPDHKYIFAPDGKGFCNYCQKVHKGPEELYDLTADPGEAVNRVAAEPGTAAALRSRLKKCLADLDDKRERLLKTFPMDGPSSPDEEEEERETRSVQKKLRSLGYMD